MIESKKFVDERKNTSSVESEIQFILPEIIRLKDDVRRDIELQSSRIDAVRSGWHVGKFFVVEATFYDGRYEPGKKVNPSKFFVKCFNQDGSRSDTGFSSPQMEIEYRLYNLLEESGVVPRAFKYDGLDNALVLDYCGGLTSEDRFSSLSDSDRESLEGLILKNIAKFNAFAYSQTAGAMEDEQIRDWLKVSKPSADKAVRYLEEYLRSKGIDLSQESLDKFRSNYVVFEEMYGKNGNQLVHGDLRRQNIVGPDGEEWNEGNIKIVDLGSMILASSLFSVAQFITSPGSKADPEKWNEMLLSYKCAEASALLGVSGGLGIKFQSPKVKEAKKRFYSSVIHSSLRGLSKMAKLKEESLEDYERIIAERPVLALHDQDMFNNIMAALKYISRNRVELGIGREGGWNLICLERSVSKYRESAIA